MSIEIKNERWNELFQKQSSVTNIEEDNKALIDSYYFIFDCSLNVISFMNTAFNTLMGYNSATFTVEDLIECMHPDDRNYFFECEEKDLLFKNDLRFNEHFNYLYTYTYRVKNSEGKFITIKQTCQALEVSNTGDLTKTLVIHQRIPDYAIRPVNDHRIYDKTRNIYLDTENCYKLTKRELEILKLVQEGLNSTEISNKLCTSKYTVDTHRKNILNKTNSTNFIDLIRKLSQA
ncbi:LuxR C-terminal-related transcriptional regulator [Sphingobacterium bovistauri]|uniref:PAS domain-containing protein n=1 Tax=Sphingobacterium bovistauri TaxID=2781959 RepID=A0ABS7Z413_9SPHI|nr:LuxR C-terminal-related transcriptional regulator [Sphingobacterium bovistauri]MCA5004895.1 PAS domain-containing protein [Sphingobacterium bovistauri]